MSRRQIGKPRGVLHRHPEEGGFFHHSRHAPADDLAPFVEHFWIVGWNLEGRAPHLAETLPHPSVHVILEQGVSRVAGVSRSRFSRRLEGNGRVFGIKFLPGGFHPFVGWPVSRITDRIVPIPELLGAGSERLEAFVLAHEEPPEMVEAAELFLRGRLPERDPVAEETGRIVARIAAEPEISKVDDLVERVGSRTRQLQRLFSRYVGVSPKWMIQRYRLHEALERIADSRSPDWPRLAFDLGYSDQAHFIKSFKELVGRTPGEYAKGLGSR
jgi:AraC-like DNA-binding protein